MPGLYILTAPFLDDAKTIKVGLSTNFAGRLKQYSDTFTNAIFRFVYKVDADLSQIREIENIVLYKTQHLRNSKLTTEYRLLTDECPLEYYKTLIADEITAKGLSFVCEENSVISKKERKRFSEQCIKLDTTNDVINNGKIEVVKKRFANKLKMNADEISNEFLEKYRQKEHIVDNVLYYLDIGSENNEIMDKRVECVNQLVNIYGFKNLFDFKTTVTKNKEMEQRMKSSELLEWGNYEELMKCFGKRMHRNKKDNCFSVSAFIMLSCAMFGEYGIDLVSDRHRKRKGHKLFWINTYKLMWDKTGIGKMVKK